MSQTPTTPRPRFKTSQDWQNFIPTMIDQKNGSINAPYLFFLRQQCYGDIEKLRGRPLLVYISKFLTPLPPDTPNSIDISDIDGFTDLANSVKGDSVDVLIHSPGGSADATERLVQILRNRFKEVHFLIPHSAYSAATMLALSGDSISIHPSATLGPIDPQINGTPARSIKRGFEKVRDIIKTDGPEALPAYLPLIEKYSLDLLELCDDSEKLSKELVCDWLKTYMFKEDPTKNIDDVADFFSNYDLHKTHSRPLNAEKLKKFELKIHTTNSELNDLLWEAWILINGFLSITAFYKLFENAHGISWGRQLSFSLPITQPIVEDKNSPS